MNPSSMPADPLGIAKSLFRLNQAWMFDSGNLPAMTSAMYATIEAAAAEQIRFVTENKAGKAQAEAPEAALLEAVKICSKLVNKFYNAYATWLRDYINCAPELCQKDKRRSLFWINQMISAFSPANFFWTNPAAVQKFLQTRGESLVSGCENLRQDIQRGDNLIQIADTAAFKVGHNIALTPGAVIFRNRLMELIQYSPRTERTYEIPVVFVQPWINKYYILDITEEKSLVAYLLNHGFTVFAVSWKNPSADMKLVNFEDYMLRGALKAIEVASEICGCEQVHAAGYCIGGTVLCALLAYLNKGPREAGVAIRDLTLFATLVDFSSPGELEVFVTEEFVKIIEDAVYKEGYLDKKFMAATFRALRSNNLIWRYFIHNYLMGEAPPKSDFLFWNSDSTRLPAAMCSYYLREFYLNNNLVKEDRLQLGNRPISLRRIKEPLYLVGTQQDHICPWKETFKIFDHVGGPKRFALSDEGHITGIVNPPSARSRRRHWVSDINGLRAPEQWLSEQREKQGSWWPDWVYWLSEKSGQTVEPPGMGNDKYPVLQKAPGSYVLEQ